MADTEVLMADAEKLMAGAEVWMALDDTTLRRKFLQMKNNSVLTDIMISCGKLTFSAHKCVLSTSSLFFNMIFTDENSQTQPHFEFDQLNMDGITGEGEVFESVVDYMYSGDIKISDDNFGCIVKMADYLVMRDLTDLCLNYLKQNLQLGNILRLYLSLSNCELSLESSEEISKRLSTDLESNFYEFIIVQDEMIQLSLEQVTYILLLGIRKNFCLTNVLLFVQAWLINRHDDRLALLEVVDLCMDICIEALNQSTDTEPNEPNQSTERVIELIEDITGLVQPPGDSSPAGSDLPECVITKLQDIQEQYVTGALIVKDDGTLSSLTETADQSNDDGEGIKQMKDEDKPSIGDQASISETYQKLDKEVNDRKSPTMLCFKSLEEVSSKKTAKSLTSSLDKIKVKAFEKSVQDRVSAFLQGQISYTLVKSKARQFKPKAMPKVALKSIQGTHKKTADKSVAGIRTSRKSKVADPVPITAALKKRTASKRGKTLGDGTENPTLGNTVKRRKTNQMGVEVDAKGKYMDDVNGETVVLPYPDDNNYPSKFSDDEMGNEYEHVEDYGDDETSTLDADYVPDQGVYVGNKQKKPAAGKRTTSTKEVLPLSDNHVQLLMQMETKLNQCVVCKCDFKRGGHLIRHISRHHKDVETWNCEKCGENFEDGKSLLWHSRSHLTALEEKLIEEIKDSDHEEYKCRICAKKFTKVKSVKGHIVQHKVSLCKPFKKEAITNETQENDGEGKTVKIEPATFTCDECPATFKQRYHLRRHIHCAHSDNFPFSCEICAKKFKMKYQYTEHMHRHTEDNVKEEEKSVLCYICGATMKNQKYLKKHLNSHAEHKRFTCTICQKSYSQSVTLQVHMRSHTGARPFQCDICSMMFAVKSNMLRHLRRHRGEKRYKCDQCGKGFLMVGDLKRHYTTHTGEKNYSCKFCGKRFNCRSKVPQHERIHTGEKPYECNICGKRFIQSGDRKRHAATHNNGTPEQQRRLTLYEIANPDDCPNGQDKATAAIDLHMENNSVGEAIIYNFSKEEGVTQGTHAALDIKREKAVTIDNAFNTSIDTAIANRPMMPVSSLDHPMTIPSTSYLSHLPQTKVEHSSMVNEPIPKDPVMCNTDLSSSAVRSNARPNVSMYNARSDAYTQHMMSRSNGPAHDVIKSAGTHHMGWNEPIQTKNTAGYFPEQTNQTAPVNMMMTHCEGPSDNRMKVVVMKNSTPMITYDSIPIPNQDFFLQKE